MGETLAEAYARLAALWHSGHPDRRGIWAAYEDFLHEECLMLMSQHSRIYENAGCVPLVHTTPAIEIPPKSVHYGSAAISREAYTKRFDEILAQMSSITNSKNANYANDTDAFANFRLIEHLSNGRVSIIDGLLTRMSDKLQRLVNLAGGTANNHESFADNCLDLAIYSIILMIAEEQRGGQNG